MYLATMDFTTKPFVELIVICAPRIILTVIIGLESPYSSYRFLFCLFLNQGHDS